VKFFKVIIIVAGVFLLTSAYAAQSTTDLFDEAGSFYRDNEVDKAIEIYENLVSTGEFSSALFYNLGNAYLKKENIGKAILNYERANVLIPRDNDLIFNLDYARGRMKQQDILYQTNLLNSFLIMSARNISLNENIFLILFSFSLFFIFVILGLYVKKIRLLLNLLAVCFLSIAGLIVVPAYYKHYTNNYAAIIVDELTDARYEPLEDSSAHFPLYEGNKVFVLRRASDWLKVKRPDGKIGWIKNNTVIRIKA